MFFLLLLRGAWSGDVCLIVLGARSSVIVAILRPCTVWNVLFSARFTAYVVAYACGAVGAQFIIVVAGCGADVVCMLLVRGVLLLLRFLVTGAISQL